MINPYQTPVTVELSAELPLSSRPLHERFDAVQAEKLYNGLIWIRTGAALSMGSVVALGVAATIQGTFDRPALTLGAGLLLTSASAGIVGMWLGLLQWAALPGAQKPVCLAALMIQAVGLMTTIGFAGRVMAGVFVGGLFRLYGASAFALLLTALAMIALINRGFARSARAESSMRASDLAVIAYALCGAICSANALRLTTGVQYSVLIALFVIGPAGTLMQWFAHHTLLLRIAKPIDSAKPHVNSLG